MSNAQNKALDDQLHAELTPRLQHVPIRRWTRAAQGHVGAWRLTGELQRRITNLRDWRASRSGVQPALRTPYLALPLLRRWRGSQDVHIGIAGMLVSVALGAHFRAPFVLATTRHLAGIGSLHRETTYIHRFHTRSIHDRFVRAEQRSLHTERLGVFRYLLSSGPSPAPIVTLMPYSGLVLPPLYSPKWTASRPQEPRPTAQSRAGFAPAAVHGTTMVLSSAPPSFHTVLALKQTVQTIAWSRATWSHRPGYTAPRLLAHVTAMPGTRSRTVLTRHKMSMVREAITYAFGASPLRLVRHATADRERPPAQLSVHTPMPLISPTRPAPAGAPGSVESIQNQVTTNVLKRINSVVAREIHRHMHFDSQDVRRLRERMYADLGSRIVFERERLGRM